MADLRLTASIREVFEEAIEGGGKKAEVAIWRQYVGAKGGAMAFLQPWLCCPFFFFFFFFAVSAR